MKTIFDLVKKPTKEAVEFDSYISNAGKWNTAYTKSDLYDNCIHIAENDRYSYYLAWDNGSSLQGVCIYRKVIE